MSTGFIGIIKQISREVYKENAMQVLFGKVASVNPLIVKISDTWKLTQEFIILDAPVEDNEEVIILKYHNSNKYLVLSTIEKVFESSSYIGGAIDTGYSLNGQWKDLGVFKVTHYCCERYPHICNAGPPYKTATGTTPHVGGCAVDPKKIPLGSYVKLNDRVFRAEDTGGGIKGNRIDIVVKTHKEALSRGSYYTHVFLKVGD